jgi:hypothetical protein
MPAEARLTVLKAKTQNNLLIRHHPPIKSKSPRDFPRGQINLSRRQPPGRENKVKPIKMFGLAVLAALMAMAFAGAGSAMAESTELCYGDPGTGASAPCPEGFEAVTTVHETSVGKAKLLASPRVECNVLFSGTVGAAAAPQVIEGHFTYTNCGCTVREVAGTTAVIKVLKTSHETGTVTGEAEVEVNCFGIVCTYNGEGLEGTAKGPLLSTQTNGEVTLSEQVVTGSGSFCPSEGKLDITTTPLVATYIGKAAALHYCARYVRPGHGFYVDENCTTESRERNKNYQLVVGAASCYDQVLEPKGLYRRVNAGTGRCEEDDATNRSLYEDWEVRRVQ